MQKFRQDEHDLQDESPGMFQNPDHLVNPVPPAVGKHRTSKVIAGRMPALPVSPGEAGVRLLSSLRPFSSQLFENQLTDSHGKRINANDLMD